MATVCALPLVHMLGRRLARRIPPEVLAVAERTWEIAPGEVKPSPRACFLPGQLERVTGWEFTAVPPRQAMQGSDRGVHAPTRGALVRDAWLIDGVLYKGRACTHLQPRAGRLPRLRVEAELERAALYCTFGGNRWFGQWLLDDCATYPLAAAEALPLTTARPVSPHEAAYEAALGMAPRRAAAVFVRELLLFDDVGQNRHKHRRFRALGPRVREALQVEAQPFPGVFLLRGGAGVPRRLRNEREVAERLRERRGFRVIDPMALDVPAIVRACAGARVVIGIEGSALIHGILHLPEGGAIVTLQPPDRFVDVYKDVADRDGQAFGFVVGTPARGGGFEIDLDEVERTLDLLPAPGASARDG